MTSGFTKNTRIGDQITFCCISTVIWPKLCAFIKLFSHSFPKLYRNNNLQTFTKFRKLTHTTVSVLFWCEKTTREVKSELHFPSKSIHQTTRGDFQLEVLLFRSYNSWVVNVYTRADCLVIWMCVMCWVEKTFQFISFLFVYTKEYFYLFLLSPPLFGKWE